MKTDASHLLSISKTKNIILKISVAFVLNTTGGSLEISYYWWDKIKRVYVLDNGYKFSFDMEIRSNLDELKELLKIPQFKESLQRTLNATIKQYELDLYKVWPNFKYLRNLL